MHFVDILISFWGHESVLPQHHLLCLLFLQALQWADYPEENKNHPIKTRIDVLRADLSKLSHWNHSNGYNTVYIQWGEQVFDSPPILQVFPLTKHVQVYSTALKMIHCDFHINVLDSFTHSWTVPMIKMTDFYMLCKWENTCSPHCIYWPKTCSNDGVERFLTVAVSFSCFECSPLVKASKILSANLLMCSSDLARKSAMLHTHTHTHTSKL